MVLKGESEHEEGVGRDHCTPRCPAKAALTCEVQEAPGVVRAWSPVSRRAPVISAFGRGRQESHKFEASWNPVSKKDPAVEGQFLLPWVLSVQEFRSSWGDITFPTTSRSGYEIQKHKPWPGQLRRAVSFPLGFIKVTVDWPRWHMSVILEGEGGMRIASLS